jgi:uncharacterized lipoprotein NlpE involved in copper resistance
MKILKTISLAIIIALTVAGCNKNGDLKGTTWEFGESVPLLGFSGVSLSFDETTVDYNMVALGQTAKLYGGTYTKSENTVSIAWEAYLGEEAYNETLTIKGKKMTSELDGTVYTKKK